MSKQTNESKSNFWLDLAADEIIRRYPDGEIIVSSGHSPSGTYHIGTIRELLTASALTWAIRERGRKAQHVDFVDDFDLLRKIPKGVPTELAQELGKPLYIAQSPDGSGTYGEYYHGQLVQALKALGCHPDHTYFAHQTYGEEHRYTDLIEKSLSKLGQVREIIEEISHRRLPEDWAPVQILSDNNRLDEWFYVGFDHKAQTVQYKTKDGEAGEVSYAEGRVKLDWRLDWPARWSIWGVNVEPFGRDHATKGGSYDTGKELVKTIFDGEAPFPVPYGFINAVGQTKKMSKSAGDVMTPADALEVMPAEVIRYFVVRSRPEKELIFDAGLGLYNLIDEFAAAQDDENHPFRDAHNFAVAGNTKRVISNVPFKHLVQVYQAAQGNEEQTLEVLSRTGYQVEVKNERDIIIAELTFVKNWLDKYAPDEVKFQVQQSLPQTDLNEAQQKFLDALAESIESHAGNIDGQAMHELIYAAKDRAELQPKEAFQALYQVILGKLYGPKAGWFLASLDQDWLIKRLKRQS